ncbi:MAG: curli production assembly/transport component CsgG [Acidobacteriota bacterium]|nr:curli production assembly/transport component CsgG [Acidobacteriota bacterium]
MLATGCASTTQLGTGGSMAAGAAGERARGSGTIALERCDEPLATIALVEDETNMQLLAEASEDLQIPASPLPLLRLLSQQSNCFQVVDRAAGLRAIDTERSLAREGLLREGSGFRPGQLVAADYSLTPHLVFADDDSGGIGLGGALVGAAVLTPILGPAGLLAAGVRVDQSEAQVVMFLTDNRSGLQVSAAEGSAKVSDFGFVGFGSGDDGGAGLMGWANTNTGKVVAAALVDGLNKVVRLVRERQP